MPPDAGRRNFKIVEQPEQQNQELIGGMKNALERGEDIGKIKKSFTAAGYKKSQIDALTQQSQQTPTINLKGSTPPQPQNLTTPPAQNQTKKHTSKKFIIILAIIGILILIAVGIVGFLWTSIF